MNLGQSTLRRKSSTFRHVFPDTMKNEQLEDYFNLKIQFKQLIETLLKIRLEFSSKIGVDTYSPLNNIQEVENKPIKPENEYEKSEMK